jgi:hypothetical protein
MPFQTQSNVQVSYKTEGSSFGILPGPTGAKVFRPTGGALLPSKRNFASAEVRRDAQRTRPRHSIFGASGGYPAELSIGTFDDLIAGLFRATWSAPLVVNETTHTSIAFNAAAKTATFGASTWQAANFRIGDTFRPSNLTNAANHRNFMIVGQSAGVANIHPAPADMAADASFTLTRPKRLLNPAIGALVRQSFTWEEREDDIDGSEIYVGGRVSRAVFRMAPGGAVTVEFGIVPKKWQVMTAGNSPYFTDPVSTISLPLSSADAKLTFGTQEILDLTALEITVDLAAGGVDTIASDSTPDVFEGPFTVTASATSLRQDMTRLLDFQNETQFSLSLLCEEVETQPVDFMSFFIGNVTFGGATKSAIAQAGGPRTQTLPMLIGKDEGRTGYDDTTMKLVTSAA